jgi:hypothetical protein
MGMDVYGENPTSDTGEYFRNNVWWWRPLWDYCVDVAPELCDGVDGESNGGDGLGAEGADDLSVILFNELASGRTAQYAKDYGKMLSELPRSECNHCEGTGTRTDAVGVEMGMTTKELEPALQIITGRTHGWCNACNGEGTQEHWNANYPFSEENVREFAEFLAECGGFKIC